MAQGNGAPNHPPVLMRLRPAPVRRAMIAAMLAVPGLWAALRGWPDGGVPALALAVVAGAAAVAMWRATNVTLVLTEEALSDSRGRVLARIDAVERVSRGALTLAPTCGFALHLSKDAPMAWVPGVWWRVGRRVGIGGTTGRRLTREMGLLVEAMLAARRRRSGAG